MLPCASTGVCTGEAGWLATPTISGTFEPAALLRPLIDGPKYEVGVRPVPNPGPDPERMEWDVDEVSIGSRFRRGIIPPPPNRNTGIDITVGVLTTWL